MFLKFYVWKQGEQKEINAFKQNKQTNKITLFYICKRFGLSFYFQHQILQTMSRQKKMIKGEC